MRAKVFQRFKIYLAIAAVFYASASEKQPLSYGLYTFFVGTIGLVELFQLPERQLD